MEAPYLAFMAYILSPGPTKHNANNVLYLATVYFCIRELAQVGSQEPLNNIFYYSTHCNTAQIWSW